MTVTFSDRKRVNFKTVKVGDTFMYQDAQIVYMKVEPMTRDGSYYVNAICLHDAAFETFEDDVSVMKVRANLTVER